MRAREGQAGRQLLCEGQTHFAASRADARVVEDEGLEREAAFDERLELDGALRVDGVVAVLGRRAGG